MKSCLLEVDSRIDRVVLIGRIWLISRRVVLLLLLIAEVLRSVPSSASSLPRMAGTWCKKKIPGRYRHHRCCRGRTRHSRE
jgi:hypothetical protein